MPEHANGTVYGKYIKIKNGTTGVKKCMHYIDDPEKIQASFDENKTEIAYAEGAIHYIQNNLKIIHPATGKHLVSGHNCSSDTAVQEFSLIEKLYHSHKSEKLAPGQTANQAFHIILSYKGTDTEPEMIHEMGCEFTRRLCGDEFQAVIATHLNTNNYHNHILVNAYALDGRHKFKDSYNVYQKFRSIANEISLEYGLPVFVNGEKETPYKSWKEFVATKEGESWKENIIHDLDESISLSSSYEEVLERMEQKGYEIQHNPKSITFKKEEGMVRDRRLGYAYTYEGICHTIEKRIKNEEYQKKIDERKKRQEQQETKIIYPMPYIPRYDQYGKRRSFFTRFLMMVKESISLAMDEQTTPTGKSPLSKHMAFETEKAKKQMKLLDETLDLVNQYSITNMNVLEMEIRELHAKNAPYKRAVFNLEDYLKKAGEIKQWIEEYQKLEPIIRAEGIDKKEIVYIPDSSVIQENQARLNPMRAKIRSDLFQAIHNSPYRLTKKFKTITETEAHKIMKIIRDGKKENLPDGLIYGRKTQGSNKEKENSFLNNTSAPSSKRTPINLKKYSAETKQAILNFKGISDKLASYGLTNEDEMNKFLNNITEKLNELTLQKILSNEINAEIKTLFKLKKMIEQFQSSIFVACPLPLHKKSSPGNVISLNELLLAEHKDDIKYDTLLHMKSRLNKLPDIHPQKLMRMKMPNPEEYRFIHDLQLLYPEKSDFYDITPQNLHYLIIKLKSEDFFDKELKKELEKEKRDKPDAQNNVSRN